MTSELFREYALLKQQEKEIKAQIDEINPKLKLEISTAGADKVETNYGTFTIMKKKLWSFSPVVIELESTVQAKREEEMANGVATFKDLPILMFKAKKTGGGENG